MSAGIPLDDADRHVWLARLHRLIANHLARGDTAVVACSALKKSYRDQLRQGNDGLQIIYLEGSFDLIRQRMATRPNHYMKAEMLQSQFDTLEPPSPHNTLIINIEQSLDNIIKHISEPYPSYEKNRHTHHKQTPPPIFSPLPAPLTSGKLTLFSRASLRAEALSYSQKRTLKRPPMSPYDQPNQSAL
jgi:gluconokinase